MQTEASLVTERQTPSAARLQAALEIFLIVTLFFVLAGTPPPDVNESHYLIKAKHYWDPAWCPADFFLDSADAHWVFYWSFGWLSRFVSLPALAWIGRLLTWTLLAWSWRRFSWAVMPCKLYSVLFAALLATLLEWGHMAGEWIIGGVEAKGFAYVLLFLALESLVQKRWRRAALLTGGAAAFHVLVGGWSLVALLWTWQATPRHERIAWRDWLPALVGAALLSLPGLVPGLALSWSADPETARRANFIYVFERLSHHLVFHMLPRSHQVRHVVLIAAWFLLSRWLRRSAPETATRLAVLNRFVFGAVLIALLGVVLDQSLLYVPNLAASILRYYWFRLSDVMVPVGVAVALCTSLAALSNAPRLYTGALAALLLVATLHVGHVAWQHYRHPWPGALLQPIQLLSLSPDGEARRHTDWQRACDWIRHNTPPDAMFLTPRHQQSFKWYAQRSEVLCAKDIPQDAAGIVEWRRRLTEIFSGVTAWYDLSRHGPDKLLQLAEKYGFRYIVLDRPLSRDKVPFPRVYPTAADEAATFEVYRVRDR